MSWNVENLFDTRNDPSNPCDDEFTPDGWRHWTPARYWTKLTNLAEVIAAVDPDILCLQEVETRGTLDDLRAVLDRARQLRYPHVVHRDGGDHRGIDVAAVARVAPLPASWIAPVPGQREILVADISPGGRPVTIMVNHWKSRIGKKAECEELRMREAAAVRTEVRRRLDADPAAAILVVGDFNDNFDEPSLVSRILSSPGPVASGPGASPYLLRNLHAWLDPAARGTSYHRAGKIWNSFDTMSVSPSMMPAAPGPAADACGGWTVVAGSYSVCRHRPMTDSEGRPIYFRLERSRETGRYTYRRGYSDHFPVVVSLRLDTSGPPASEERPR